MCNLNPKLVKKFKESVSEHLPQIKVVAIDNTKYWRDDIASKAKKIEAVHVIDFSRLVHICSLTGSYEAWYLYDVHDNHDLPESELESLEDEIREGNIDTPLVDYYHQSSTFNVVYERPLYDSDLEHIMEEGYDDWMREDVLEDFNCNHVY